MILIQMENQISYAKDALGIWRVVIELPKEGDAPTIVAPGQPFDPTTLLLAPPGAERTEDGQLVSKRARGTLEDELAPFLSPNAPDLTYPQPSAVRPVGTPYSLWPNDRPQD